MLVNQIRIYFDHFLPNRCRSSDGDPTCLWAYKKRQDDGNSRHPAADGYALLRVAMSATSTMVRFVLFVCYINYGALCPLRLLHHLRCALSSSSATSTMVRFVLFVRYINYGALCPLRPLHQLWCALSSSSATSPTVRFVLFVRYGFSHFIVLASDPDALISGIQRISSYYRTQMHLFTQI
jgi:hypothetical protein